MAYMWNIRGVSCMNDVNVIVVIIEMLETKDILFGNIFVQK